jgi:hypothetical protein
MKLSRLHFKSSAFPVAPRIRICQLNTSSRKAHAAMPVEIPLVPQAVKAEPIAFRWLGAGESAIRERAGLLS